MLAGTPSAPFFRSMPTGVTGALMLRLPMRTRVGVRPPASAAATSRTTSPRPVVIGGRAERRLRDERALGRGAGDVRARSSRRSR